MEGVPAMRKEQKNILGIIVKAGIVALSLLALGKSIFISLDIDESYAVAAGYRLVQGDRLLSEMWEPHQFSAFLAALFTAPYVWLRGDTQYLIVYLRIVGVMLHTLLGIALYGQVKKSFGETTAFCILALHLNFLPKWVQIPEFELMHYWSLLGTALLLWAYFSGKRRRYLLFFGGVVLAVSVMCYPTMVLLYPFYLVGICALERRYFGIKAGTGWLFFTAGASAAGAALVGWLFSYMSPRQLRHFLSYLFMDTSHGVYTFGQKLQMHLEQLGEQGSMYLVCVLLAAGILLCIQAAGNFRCRLKSRKEKAALWKAAHPVTVIAAVLLLAALLMQVRTIFGNVFGDENQFYCQARYLAVIIPAAVLGFRYYEKMAIWLWCFVIPGVVSVCGVLLVTNMGTNEAYSKAFTGVLGGLLILAEFCRSVSEKNFGEKSIRVLRYAVSGAMLAGLLVCRLLLIRVTGCLPVTVLAPMERMETGPEKGIYVLADRAEIWNDNYRELETYVRKEDRLLYIGAENLVYPATRATAATPSTQGTTVFDETFLYYYREHPERIPNVVVYDKTFGEKPAYALYYGFSLQNGALFDWLRENYGDCQVTETAHLIILRKQQG